MMYAISEDGTYYSNATYGTKEEAIKAGLKEFKDSTIFYVGETVDVKVEPGSFDGDELAEKAIDLLTERLEDIGGEFAENFSVSQEDENSLAEHIMAAVQAWIETRDIKPGFFLVENDEKINIPEFLKGAGL